VGTYHLELPRSDGRGSGAASLLVHSLAIASAVLATMRTTAQTFDPHIVVPVSLLEPARPPAPPPPGPVLAGIVTPVIGTVLPGISAVIPRVIPPPGTAPFDPSSFLGFGPAVVAPASDTAARQVAVYSDRVVDDPPVLVSRPPLVYPPLFREAGIGGEAVIEAVIDTAGRAERGSIRVVSASHALFAQPAMDLVAGALFRPGRLDGRAVRVRVRLPINFRVDRPGSTMSGTP